MARKDQNRNLVILLIVAVAIIFFSINGFQFGSLSIIGDPGKCDGQVLNIDPDIELTSSNELQKDVIRATYSNLPGNECLKLVLSEEDLENQIGDFEANGDILLDIELIEQSRVFNIFEDQGQEMFNSILIEDEGSQFFCTESDCTAHSNYISSFFPNGFDDTCLCAYAVEEGVGGEFQLGSDLKWRTNFKLGNLDTLVLTDEIPSGQISDIVFAKWAGNGLTNDIFEGISGVKDAYLPFSDNNWRLIDNDVDDELSVDFEDAVEELEDCDFFGACDSGYQEALGYISEFQEKTADQTVQFSVEEPDLLDGGTIIEGNEITLRFINPPTYQQFILDLAVEEVGIFINIGEPSVSCPADFDLDSGDLVTQNLQVSNVGGSAGLFEYYVTCDDGSVSLSPSSPQNVNAGDTLNVNGQFGFTVEEGTESAECTFRATDQGSCEFGNCLTDSCTFSMESTHTGQCEVGTQSCESGNTELWTCLEDGSYDKLDCSFGCTTIPSPQCAGEAPGEICGDNVDNDLDGFIDDADADCQNGCEWWNLLCQFSGGFDFFTVLKNILVFAGGFLSIFVVKDFSEKLSPSLKRNRAAVNIFSILIGLGIGFFLFLFIGSLTFFITLISLGAFFIVLKFIPFRR